MPYEAPITGKEREYIEGFNEALCDFERWLASAPDSTKVPTEEPNRTAYLTGYQAGWNRAAENEANKRTNGRQ